MKEQLLQTWEIHNRINVFLLEGIEPAALWIKPPKGRAAGAQFAHMHSVRMMWLKQAAPELLEGLEKVEDGAGTEQLKAALQASGARIAALLDSTLDTGRVKGFKPHAQAFLCYFIAHEAHHRGQTELILREIGQPVSDKVSYGLWEWGSR